MRLNPLRMYDELEINTSIEKFKDECKIDKTTYSFVRSLDIKYERKLSTDQKFIIFGRDMMIACFIMSILMVLAVVFDINPIVEILWRCCMTTLTIFNILYTISMCIRYVGDVKNLIEFYNKPELCVTTGETIGLIKSRYNMEIPIIKYEIDNKTYIACPNMYTKNNELESKPVIIYDSNNPHKFFIQGSSYHKHILTIELFISIAYLISTIIILIL